MKYILSVLSVHRQCKYCCSVFCGLIIGLVVILWQKNNVTAAWYEYWLSPAEMALKIIDERSLYANVDLEFCAEVIQATIQGLPPPSPGTDQFCFDDYSEFMLPKTVEVVKLEYQGDVSDAESRRIGCIGYIKISLFNEMTADIFDTAMSSFQDDSIDCLMQSKVPQVIIDLRGNPGGLLDTVVWMLRTVGKEGDKVIETHTRDGAIKSIVLPEDGKFSNYKIVILVDNFSASASEVFAGTLKDWNGKYGRYTLVGYTNTHGKGIVQSLFSLKDGFALKLTTEEYFVGNNAVKIHGIGVSPHYTVIGRPPAQLSDICSQKDRQCSYAIKLLTRSYI